MTEKKRTFVDAMGLFAASSGGGTRDESALPPPETVGALVKKIEGEVGSSTALAAALESEEIETDLLDAMLSAAADGYESRRWLEIGKEHLQQGFMALTRAIARPTTF